MRIRRVSLGMLQKELADRLGISFQQVQKYEGGENRIGGSRLFDISCALGVPVNYFFEEIPDGIGRLSPAEIVKREAVPQDVSFQPPLQQVNRSEQTILLRHMKAAKVLSELGTARAMRLIEQFLRGSS